MDNYINSPEEKAEASETKSIRRTKSSPKEKIESYKLAIMRKEEEIKKLQDDISKMEKKIQEIEKKENEKDLMAIGQYLQQKGTTAKDFLKDLMAQEKTVTGGQNYGNNN